MSLYPKRTNEFNPNWKGGLPKCLDCERLINRHTKYGRCSGCYRKMAEYRTLTSIAHKGQKAWNKGLVGFLSGEEHYNWNKGISRNYSTLHIWVNRRLGKASQCSKCHTNKNVQWSNISNEYKRDLSDWQELCVKHHIEYDKEWRLKNE